MIKVIVGRLLQLIPVLVVILTLTFFMSKMVPGGPFSAERQATPEVIARLNAYYGLDRPLWEQYLSYLGNVVKFNFGPSYTYQSESVNEVIARAFPISLQIGTLAFCIALIIGVTAGVVGSQFRIAGVQPSVAPYSIFLAFGAAVLTGLFFGKGVRSPLLKVDARGRLRPADDPCNKVERRPKTVYAFSQTELRKSGPCGAV